MKAKKIITLALSTLLLFSMTGCGSTQVESAPMQHVLTDEEIAAIADKIPDYSSSGKQYQFFGYSSVSNGRWTDFGVDYYCGQNLMTLEQFTMYKDAGFTIMHPQGVAGIQAADNFVYSSSQLKKVLDLAQASGIDKVIVPDYRITSMIADLSTGMKAAKEQTFDTYTDTYEVFTDNGELDQVALENKLKEFMGEYVQHPSFYGVNLNDEPAAKVFEAYGEVYRAIKRVYPQSFALANLHPPAGFKDMLLEDIYPTEEEIAEFASTTFAERLAKWKVYITEFLDKTGIDYLMYDQYPVDDKGLHDLYLRGIQIAADVCKEKGVEFCFVAQTCTINNTRTIDAETAAWINNMLIGMGVKTIGYFTYFDRDSNDVENYYDGGGFVTHFGEKTKVYDIMQKIMANNQKFAPTMLSFDYNASNVYIAGGTNKYMGAYILNGSGNATFAKLANVAIDKESVLVSELVNKNDNRYMYMVQNIVDPIYTGAASYQTVTLTFNENYNYAVVWSNGESQVVSLVNNQYTVTQHPGQAVYVIPFNA